MDYSTAPDDTSLVPEGRCGHSVTVGSMIANRVAVGPHVEHVNDGLGWATRENLGTADRRRVQARIVWSDDRPAATVGDLRRLIRENQ